MEISKSRLLYIQLVLTIAAFGLMVFSSHLFTRGIVRKNLVNNAESVFAYAQAQLESDLLEPKIILSGFSQSVSSMLSRGDSMEAVNKYLHDYTDYLHSNNSPMMKSITLFGYFDVYGEKTFLSSSNITLNDINPPERPWYIEAAANCGEIIFTNPYEHIITGEKVLAYARCLHDERGRQIAVVGLNISVSYIGSNIVNVALSQDGYGMLVTSEFEVIAHANSEFIGKDVRDPDLPLSKFADDFVNDRLIWEEPLTNWKGERTIAFFKKLDNGFFLGLLTPEDPFYSDISAMAITLIILGSIFAIALITGLISIDTARNKSDRENKHKSAFLANMSHEIRTPMNAIIGMITIGKSSSEVEKKNHCFEKIEDASNHLLGVINDILDMSKIEANKFELSHAEFNFEKMLQRIVNVVNFRVDEKHHKFTVYIDKNIPKSLIGDDQRLAQVITNLLGNAIKFTPENGSINLNTRLLEENDGMCSLQVSISDTGIGMTSEQQKRAFSSFEQAESSTTRKYGGTGLGLAISKSIIELMGGYIGVTSEVGKGSTFTFNIKMKRGIASPHKILSSDVNLENVRIMVVDDDQDILDYFKEISCEFGVNCDTALSGDDAIKIIKEKGRYHIYFVDWKMPGMDGIQLTAELKAHQEPVKSVVIMITAAEWTEVESEAKKAGVDKFLSKPLFPSCIANVINEALGIDRQKLEDAKIKDIENLYAGRNILLVEDVEINRDIVLALLEPTGINVDCAYNGKEAVRLFGENPDKYEIIFMDVQMPEMDGYEATSKIRVLEKQKNLNKGVPIVAMTANVFREDVERCMKAGMDSHIGKPLDFNELLEKLNIYLPKKHSSQFSVYGI
ncbi:MAG: response regulator [Treponema sp.]|nr:response regulator [Treponema sp.]